MKKGSKSYPLFRRLTLWTNIQLYVYIFITNYLLFNKQSNVKPSLQIPSGYLFYIKSCKQKTRFRTQHPGLSQNKKQDLPLATFIRLYTAQDFRLFLTF